ncbi:MAG: thioredoxin-like domain-containing protein, partial [Bacteroidota bacterium]|nr:thioredoxin-like domain-containing protein [Bacteroidota bacterium]
EVKAYQRKIVSENKDKLIGKILNMSIDPVIPDEIIENDTLKYKFYLNHFWDNIDLGDARIVHSPVYHNKLNYFFKKLLIQHPDTICRYAHKILSKIEEGTDLFKYTVHFITYNFETSKIMGMDGVFVCMAKDYYCPPDNSKAFWLKKEKLDELCEKASALEPLLIGKMAPRIILADTSEKKWIDFYQLPNKYNLLIFWDPDCGHCKKEIPKLKKMYQELKDMNVDIEFIAVGTNLENDKWKKFISKNQLKWINLSDFPEANENPKKYLFEKRVTDLKSLNFRKTYDIFSTPQVYLLDANKKIIGKKLDALTFGNLLQQLEKIKIPYVQLLEKQKEEKEKEKEKKNNNVNKAD